MRTLFAAFFWAALGVSGALAQNAIVTENQLPGTPQSTWDLLGPGSASIQGFTTDISVNHGSTVSFKVKTSTNHWKIDIYRLGYYQGNGARLITTINMTSAQSQPAPLHDTATGLYDAGNWAVSTTWTVPASAVSGVYIAKLTDLNNTNNQNHIPFIVRADESTSDILFQTSDTTWQAYNGWFGGNSGVGGGTNLYGGTGPGGDSAPGRAYKVSYNRPFATHDSCGFASGAQDFVFTAEFPAIQWLEQNGHDVSYIAEVDTARSPALLRNHKIFTSTGHDEYWSGDQRASVEAALANGVNLAFLSGNEVYWKTRWEPSIDGSATPFRTLVCYKETRHHDPLDPLDAAPTWTWTGTWRDLRFSPPADGGRPENGLTGTIFAFDSYRSDPITVPYPMTLLRFWRNTPHVANTAPSGSYTLTQNILGYEWDASPDNGFAPAGLINLSSTTLSVNTFLLNYGTRTGDGSATHNLTLYKHPTSGALVFGAGTVFWAWGLGPVDDGVPTPTDPDIQQAMVNVFADMGVQPATLQAGLVPAVKSTDTTPPVSGISAPANGATFTTGQPVAISGFASDAGGRVAGVEVSLDGGATWHRASGTTSWSYGWTPASAGTYTIKSRPTDDSLNSETPSAGTGITVSPFGSSLFLASDGPSLITADDANAVELGVKFRSSVAGTITGVRFYKNPINFGLPNLPVHTVHLWNTSGTLLASATVANETVSGWQQANLPTPVAIAANTTYIASYHSNGYYSANAGYFDTAHANGPLTAPDSASSGGNDVYVYSSGVSFPSQTFLSENYWVDVVFAATPVQPAITSALTASGTAGTLFSYTITASNNPTSFNATGLPGGLSVNTTTGVISGTPTAARTSSVTLSATNAAGTGSATLSLTITQPSPVLLGSQVVQSTVDTNSSGSAEAFQATATASGTVKVLSIYLDSSSTAATLVVGLYTDSGGHPGTLISQATTSPLTPGAWNNIPIPGAAVTSGTKYWLAILGTGNGTLAFRDGSGCTSENSLQTNLTALPSTWSSGAVYPSCPLSGYGRT